VQVPGCCGYALFSPFIETTLDALSLSLVTVFAIHGDQLGADGFRIYFSIFEAFADRIRFQT